MNKPDKDGVTEREHLEAVYKQTGKKPIELELPEFPNQLAYIWSAFFMLNRSRTYSDGVPSPITYEQILAWKNLTETPFGPKEVEVITRIDRIYLGAMSNNG